MLFLGIQWTTYRCQGRKFDLQYLARIWHRNYEALPADVEAQLRNDEEENFIVTTYTYKPLVGITSITDPSGHSVYYEYNDSGKLKVIRDDKGKVLKSYDYHIVTDNQ